MPGSYPGGYQPQPGAYPPPGFPSAGYAMPATRQTDSKAIVGLILAIGSWLFCPVILAVVALVMASQSNKAIAMSAGRLDGRGLNTATKWISWINIVLYILGALAFAAFMVWAYTQDPTIFDTPGPLDTQF